MAAIKDLFEKIIDALNKKPYGGYIQEPKVKIQFDGNIEGKKVVSVGNSTFLVKVSDDILNLDDFAESDDASISVKAAASVPTYRGGIRINESGEVTEDAIDALLMSDNSAMVFGEYVICAFVPNATINSLVLEEPGVYFLCIIGADGDKMYVEALMSPDGKKVTIAMDALPDDLQHVRDDISALGANVQAAKTAADNAQSTANSAKTAADNALKPSTALHKVLNMDNVTYPLSGSNYYHTGMIRVPNFMNSFNRTPNFFINNLGTNYYTDPTSQCVAFGSVELINDLKNNTVFKETFPFDIGVDYLSKGTKFMTTPPTKIVLVYNPVNMYMAAFAKISTKVTFTYSINASVIPGSKVAVDFSNLKINDNNEIDLQHEIKLQSIILRNDDNKYYRLSIGSSGELSIVAI